MNDVIQVLSANWKAVADAPVPFLTCLAILGFGIWLWVEKAKGQQLSNLQSRLDLKSEQVENYRNRLDGKSPDEAKAELDQLKLRLAAVEPPVLTQSQIRTLTASVGAFPGRILISHNVAAAMLGRLHGQLLDGFGAAGWEVSQAQAMGVQRGRHAVVVYVRDTQNMNAQQRAAVDGMRAAEIDFALVQMEPPTPHGPPPDVQIYLNAT